MKSQAQSISSILRRSMRDILISSVIIIFPFVFVLLTIVLTDSELSKLHLLSKQIAASIKSEVQVGDEIQIRRDLQKLVENSPALAVKVSGDSVSPIQVVKPSYTAPENKTFQNQFFNIFLSNQLEKSFSLKMYPNQERKFSVSVTFGNTLRAKIFSYALLFTFLIGACLFFILWWKTKQSNRKIIPELETLRDYIQNFDRLAKKRHFDSSKSPLSEVRMIKDRFDRLQKHIHQQQGALIEKSVREEKGRLAEQIAHDLKYYTSVMSKLIEKLGPEIPDEDRLLLKKAAGDISKKMRELQRLGQIAADEENSSFVLQLVPHLLHLVDLKKIEFNQYESIKMEVDLQGSDLGIFVKIDPLEFDLALSNLITNSIEAMLEQNSQSPSGQIIITAEKEEGVVRISIKDDGPGIEPERLLAVRERGSSSKGGQNRGLGLTKAINIIESFDGELELSSKQGKDTTVTLSLPPYVSRAHAVSEIDLSQMERVVMIENDELSRDQLQDFVRTQVPGTAILSFEAPSKFLDWLKKNDLGSKTFLLVDYDFGESEQNGLDLIISLQAEGRSILITHNFDNRQLLDQVDQRGVKLLPKSVLGNVRVIAEEAKAIEKCDGIVVDDDELLLSNLQKMAQNEGLRLELYRKPAELRSKINCFDKSVPIILDSKFDRMGEGEEFAKHLHREGFLNIAMNSSYTKKSFTRKHGTNLSWIKGFLNKDPERVLRFLKQARAS